MEKQRTSKDMVGADASTTEIQDWGLIAYDKALAQQLELVEKVADENLPGTVAFCSHPSVVTLGRAWKKDDLQGWRGTMVEVSRGGRATYHGPHQIIAYPILNLDYGTDKRPQHDVHAALRSMEDWLISGLAELGVEVTAKPQFPPLGEGELSGVWFNSPETKSSAKLASIGIAVKRWVTYHGVALNVNDDPVAFTGIQPCGFSPKVMTNLEQILKRKVDPAEVRQILQRKVHDSFF